MICHSCSHAPSCEDFQSHLIGWVGRDNSIEIEECDQFKAIEKNGA